MVSTPAPPPAPDPARAAAAQAGMNRDTAIAQQQTNMIDQYGPQGSLTYHRMDGQDHTYIDSKGKAVTIPRYRAVTALSPEEQQLYDLTSQIKHNIGRIGVDQSQRIGELLGTPVNLNNEATEARLAELGSKRLDPRFAREEETLRTRLANQGVGQGSEAWNNAFNNFSQTKNDAYNQLYLTGRDQAMRESLAERNQPINEISALLSGSQVSMPQHIQTPQSPVQPVDYMGMLNSQYQAQMQAYGQQLAARSNMLGGIFGVLGKGIGAFTPFSDRRLKSNVAWIGTWPNGLNVYEYDIFGRREQGFMADEVLARFPHAVGERAGYLTVNYAIAMEAI